MSAPLVFDAPWASAAFAATVVGRRVVERVAARARGQRTFDRRADRGTSRQILASGLLGLLAAVGLSFVSFARIPGGWIVVVAGLALAWSGTAIRLWARLTLDRFFQPVVVVQEDHAVVDKGPYRLLRHPAYAGSIVGLAGIGLALESWLSLAVILAPALVAYHRRIAVEEAELSRALGERYDAYVRRTWRLVPGVW